MLDLTPLIASTSAQVRGCSLRAASRFGLIRLFSAEALERRRGQGVTPRRDGGFENHKKEDNHMNNPSIYDFRDAEVATAARIRRERIARAIEAAVCIPALVAAAVIFFLVCACA